MKLSFRHFLATVAGAFLAHGAYEAWNVRVTRYTIALDELPPQAEGMRILQLSDLHAGALAPTKWIRHVIELCNEQGADLIAITGDFISRRNSYARFSGARTYARTADVYAERVARELAALSAPMGVFGVPGNHDYGDSDYGYLAEILRPAGVESLVNEARKLPNGLWLIGVDDLRCGKPRLRETLSAVPPGEAQVVLSHNPRAAWLMRERNALILSGHTHGGQIRLFGIVRTPVDVLSHHWLQGLFRLSRAKLYVSSGAGSIFLPMRYRVPPEITVFTLTSS